MKDGTAGTEKDLERLVLENQVAVTGNPGVTWTRLAFRK
jgi:hypothetical protein